MDRQGQGGKRPAGPRVVLAEVGESLMEKNTVSCENRLDPPVMEFSYGS